MEEAVELVVGIESDVADVEEVRAQAQELITDLINSSQVESAELSRSDVRRDAESSIAAFSVVVIWFLPSALPALMDVVRAWLGRRGSRAVSLDLMVWPLSGSQYNEITELEAAIRESFRESEPAVKVSQPIPAYESEPSGQPSSLPSRPPGSKPAPGHRSRGLRGRRKSWTPEAPAASAPPVQRFADEIDRALAAVMPGRFAFNPPAQMRQGDKEHVTVGVVRSRDLDDELRASLRGSGVPEFDDIRTSPLMKVDLRGDGAFEITAESESEQPVGSTEVTNWEFEVRAVRAGDHTLTVVVALVLQVPGHEDVRSSQPVLERSVHVQVAPVYATGQFVRSYWQWIIGTGVAAGAAVAA